MQGGIGIIEKRQEMIGAVFFEKEIVEGGIPKFPCVHQETPYLMFREIEAIFPDIPIFDVSILLHLQVVGDRREVPTVPAENATDRIGHSGVGRNICCIINRVGQDSGAVGLAPLIYPKQRMPKHRRGIIQEGGGKNERDRLGLKIGEPSLEPLAGHRRSGCRDRM